MSRKPRTKTETDRAASSRGLMETILVSIHEGSLPPVTGQLRSGRTGKVIPQSEVEAKSFPHAEALARRRP